MYRSISDDVLEKKSSNVLSVVGVGMLIWITMLSTDRRVVQSYFGLLLPAMFRPLANLTKELIDIGVVGDVHVETSNQQSAFAPTTKRQIGTSFAQRRRGATVAVLAVNGGGCCISSGTLP